MSQKIPYICGPLTELVSDPWHLLRAMRAVVNCLLWLFLGRRLLTFTTAQEAKALYEGIASRVARLPGQSRPFVPHEHYDPKRHAHFTPAEVDKAEREQVCQKTSLLIVIAVAPSWGGGIEVEWANQSGIPAILLWRRGTNLSRLLRGNPSVAGIIVYDTLPELFGCLSNWITWELPECRKAS